MSYLPTIPFPSGAASPVTAAPPARFAGSLPAESAERVELLGIVRRARDGDMEAQSELVRRYSKRLPGYVRPIVWETSAVEDVVQMAFIKMVRRLELLRDPETFEPWLFALARNTAIDFTRRARCRPATISDEGDFMHAPDQTSPRAVPEIMEALEAALTSLSPKDRNLVRMIVQGVSYQAAAAREGLTVGAVKLRLNRVRPFLRASVGGAIDRPAVKKTSRLPQRHRVAA